MTQQQQGSGGRKEEARQQGRVLDIKPISVQFVATPQEIRDAMHDLTPLLDGTVRLGNMLRIELTAPSEAGEFLDCTLYTENEGDRQIVTNWLRTHRVEIDENATRPGTRQQNSEQRPRNG